ncbi:MAG: helix-turn-helix domain-containing protein [Planctomycetaceae bacterium]|nr:helix-turn-helix domain-containing protein [Planctomycetaceae bacterium]
MCVCAYLVAPFARLFQWYEWGIRLVQHSVPVFMHTRLLEIQKEIRTHSEQVIQLCDEAATLLNCSETEPELVFDDEKRTIKWEGSYVKLSKKQFVFIKTLWNGKNHTATLDEIEETVWYQTVPAKKMFLVKNTIFALVNRLRNSVIVAEFPYHIESVRIDSDVELSGYRLVFKQ